MRKIPILYLLNDKNEIIIQIEKRIEENLGSSRFITFGLARKNIYAYFPKYSIQIHEHSHFRNDKPVHFGICFENLLKIEQYIINEIIPGSHLELISGDLYF